MWQNWQFFMAKFANFCGKIWQNLGFQMAIFCDARFKMECVVKWKMGHWKNKKNASTSPNFMS